MELSIDTYVQRLNHAPTQPAIDEVPKLAKALLVAWKNK